MLIVDTGVLVATADRRDPDHERSRSLLEDAAGPLVTTGLVIAEAGHLIDRQIGSDGEIALCQSIIDGDLQVEPLIAGDWSRVRELLVDYADLRLGVTDASVVAIAERLQAEQIATLDENHFRVVRPKHVPAFELLP